MGGLSLLVSIVLSKFKPCSRQLPLTAHCCGLRKFGCEFLSLPWVRLGFPGGSNGKKKSACNAGDLGSILGSGRSPEEGMLTTLVFLPGEFHGQRSLMGYMQYMGCKQSGMTERLTLTTRLRYIIVMNSMSAYSKTLNRKSNNVLK